MENSIAPILRGVKVSSIERKMWPSFVEYRCVVCGMVFAYQMVQFHPEPKQPKQCETMQGGCARTSNETRFEKSHTAVRDVWEVIGKISRETYIVRSESEPVGIESGDQIDIVPSLIQRKRGTRQTWQCIVQEWS
jgi:hypothetical protein